jgi:hypothetical protein
MPSIASEERDLYLFTINKNLSVYPRAPKIAINNSPRPNP